MPGVIVVSPHLDDAALSCGGGIARLVGAGVPVTVVTVVTVFTADQPLGEPLSPLARRAHLAWGVGDQPFAVRRAEDFAAAKLMGVLSEHLGLLDAIYRRSPLGEPLYSAMLGEPAADDEARFLPRLVETLRGSSLTSQQWNRVLCPTGIGEHPDHVLTRQAVEQIVDPRSIVYYDEYPYSTRPESATQDVSEPNGPTPHKLPLTAEETDARIAAIACHTSQLRGLFPSGYERLADIASARIPVVGAWMVRPPDAKKSRARMAEQVRRESAQAGGETYRWPSESASPFPSA
jgi:LmbE family N-acetylglucosaminyl deacetylase